MKNKNVIFSLLIASLMVPEMSALAFDPLHMIIPHKKRSAVDTSPEQTTKINAMLSAYGNLIDSEDPKAPGLAMQEKTLNNDLFDMDMKLKAYQRYYEKQRSPVLSTCAHTPECVPTDVDQLTDAIKVKRDYYARETIRLKARRADLTNDLNTAKASQDVLYNLLQNSAVTESSLKRRLEEVAKLRAIALAINLSARDNSSKDIVSIQEKKLAALDRERDVINIVLSAKDGEDIANVDDLLKKNAALQAALLQSDMPKATGEQRSPAIYSASIASQKPELRDAYLQLVSIPSAAFLDNASAIAP